MKQREYGIFVIFSLTLLLAIVYVSPAATSAIIPEKATELLPFDPAEKLVYEGEFTRAMLRGIDIADLSFSYSRVTGKRQGETVNITQGALRFTAEALSKGIVSKLFGLTFRQRIESIVDPASFSVLKTTKLDEQGKRRRTSEAVFDPLSGSVVFTELDPNDPSRPPRIVISKNGGQVLDIASAFYYLRTLKLEPGLNIDLDISDTGQVYRTPVRVIKRERIKTLMGNITTLRVVPELFGEGRLIRGKGEITIWFTDDARHIPVRAKINNSLGRLDIKLKSVTKAR